MNAIQEVNSARGVIRPESNLKRYGLGQDGIAPFPLAENFPNAVNRASIETALASLEKKSREKWSFGHVDGKRRYVGEVHPGLEGRLEEVEAFFGDTFRGDLYVLAPERMWEEQLKIDPVFFLRLTDTWFWPIFAFDGDKEIPLDWKPVLNGARPAALVESLASLSLFGDVDFLRKHKRIERFLVFLLGLVFTAPFVVGIAGYFLKH